MPVEPGIRYEHSIEVTVGNAVSFLGLESARVLGTPFLIYSMEMAARNAVLPYLEPGFDTVGTVVNVRHLAATPLGMKFTARATVAAVQGRRISFTVEAFDEREKIGEGTHERAIIDVARFGERVQAKRAPLSGSSEA